MKKISRKALSVILSNALLVVIIVSVFVVGFSFNKAYPIYGGKRENAIYRGNVENKNASLMFNCYEGAEVVSGIIDLLDEKGVKGTFFVGGCWADDNEIILKKIVKSGHEIANHGYFHKDHKTLSYEENYAEIENTGKVIEGLCGISPTLFAPPSGSFSDKTLDSASDLGYKIIMWSSDTIDWRDSDENLIYNRAIKTAENGELILMHPKKHTLSVLPKIIDFYINNGFNLVTVSDNIK